MNDSDRRRYEMQVCVNQIGPENSANTLEASFSSTASATAEHVAATAASGAKVREVMVCVRVLDGVVKNKYADNPGKLAAWISASHVEKPRRKRHHHRHRRIGKVSR